MSDAEFAIELRGIRKRFGSTVALHDATLVVRPGTVHMLLGENGAGKTTLLNVATGLTPPDAGTIRLHGGERAWRSAHEAIAHGVVAVHQHFALVPTLSVAENVALTNRTVLARFDAGRAAAFVRRVAAEAGLEMGRRLKAATDKPVLLGLGVSDGAQARTVASAADGVIVGSAVVRRQLETGSPVEVGAFVRSLREGLDAG